MPKGKRPQRTPWLFRDKPVIAHATDSANFQYCDRFSVSIRYENSTNQGSITLHHVVHVDDFASVQSLSLVVRPENIVESHISDDCNLPVDVLRLIPEVSSGLIVLSLQLHNPGTVLCPIAPLPLPIAAGELGNKQFVAFSSLCQATKIRLYLGRNQLQSDQLDRLQKFVSALSHPGDVCANPIDLRCLAGGKGAQETTWCYLHPQSVVGEPSQNTSSAEHEVDFDEVHNRQKKRSHPLASSPAQAEPPVKLQKLWHDVPPPGSPTEVNTPSTRPTTSEPGTRPHTPIPAPDFKTSTTPNTASTQGEIPLPAYTAEHTLSSPYLPSSKYPSPSAIKPTLFQNLPNSQPDLSTILTSLLQQTLPPLITNAFTTILGPMLDSRIEALITSTLEQQVRSQLPSLTHKILQQNLETYLDNLEHAQRTAEVEISETIDEAKTEICEAKDQGIKEIEGCVDEQIQVFDGQVEEVMGDAVTSLLDKAIVLEERIEERYKVGHGDSRGRRRKSV